MVDDTAVCEDLEPIHRRATARERSYERFSSCGQTSKTLGQKHYDNCCNKSCHKMWHPHVL